MAKRKVNKTQAIRDALKANKGKSPSEIAEALTRKGIKVSPQYVSTVKSTSKAKKSSTRASKTTRGRKTMRGGSVGNGSTFSTALELVRAAGGIKQAQQMLSTIEEIRRAVR